MIDGMENIVAFVTIVDKDERTEERGNRDGGLHEVLLAAFQRAGGCFAGVACDNLTTPPLKLNIAEILAWRGECSVAV